VEILLVPKENGNVLIAVTDLDYLSLSGQSIHYCIPVAALSKFFSPFMGNISPANIWRIP
jgi:hypothetical protein